MNTSFIQAVPPIMTAQTDSGAQAVMLGFVVVAALFLGRRFIDGLTGSLTSALRMLTQAILLSAAGGAVLIGIAAVALIVVVLGRASG